MSFRLEFETDNDAFSGYVSDEIARVLRKVAGQVESGQYARPIHDINGNTVGRFELTETEREPESRVGETTTHVQLLPHARQWECYCDHCRWRVIVASFDRAIAICDAHDVRETGR